MDRPLGIWVAERPEVHLGEREDQVVEEEGGDRVVGGLAEDQVEADRDSARRLPAAPLLIHNLAQTVPN